MTLGLFCWTHWLKQIEQNIWAHGSTRGERTTRLQILQTNCAYSPRAPLSSWLTSCSGKTATFGCRAGFDGLLTSCLSVGKVAEPRDTWTLPVGVLASSRHPPPLLLAARDPELPLLPPSVGVGHSLWLLATSLSRKGVSCRLSVKPLLSGGGSLTGDEHDARCAL